MIFFKKIGAILYSIFNYLIQEKNLKALFKCIFICCLFYSAILAIIDSYNREDWNVFTILINTASVCFTIMCLFYMAFVFIMGYPFVLYIICLDIFKTHRFKKYHKIIHSLMSEINQVDEWIVNRKTLNEIKEQNILEYRKIDFDIDRYIEIDDCYNEKSQEILKKSDSFKDINKMLEEHLKELQFILTLKKELSMYCTKKCEHGGYLLFPKESCPQCAESYGLFCKQKLLVSQLEQIELEKIRLLNQEQELARIAKEKEEQELARIAKEKKEKEEQELARIAKEREYLNREKRILYNYENPGRLTPEEIGSRYERYIGYLYECLGYDVFYHGIRRKKEDDGIDLYAKKDQELIIIQCKWYKEEHRVHNNTIRQLNDNLSDHISDNPDKKVIAKLYTAYDQLDSQALAKLDRLRKEERPFEHIVMPYDKDYPKIKCNISASEKIYHLPGEGAYDSIKINIASGECYVKTIEEARALGFRGITRQ